MHTQNQSSLTFSIFPVLLLTRPPYLLRPFIVPPLPSISSPLQIRPATIHVHQVRSDTHTSQCEFLYIKTKLWSFHSEYNRESTERHKGAGYGNLVKLPVHFKFSGLFQRNRIILPALTATCPITMLPLDEEEAGTNDSIRTCIHLIGCSYTCFKLGALSLPSRKLDCEYFKKLHVFFGPIQTHYQ